MPRERDPPYVAYGFREDAERLLKRFVDKRTLQFEEFAEVWRELNFALIFMGREGLRELTEFIEECYRNTLLFMDSTNPYMKVGAVYLLYSLYMKQPSAILKTRIPITIVPKQVADFCEVEDYFMNSEVGHEIMDLTYIIFKLFKMNAFYVACFPIPMGPVVPVPLLKLEPLRNSAFKESLSALSMLNERDVKNVVQLTKTYEKLKKTLPCLCSSSKSKGILSSFSELRLTIQELEDRYNAGLLPNKVCGDIKIEEEFRYLGRRRAMLKSQQFEKTAQVGMSRRVRDSDDSSPEKPRTPVKRGPGRPRKIKQGRGRKKKILPPGQLKPELGAETVDDDDLETEVIDIDDPDYIHGVPECRRPRRRRRSRFPRPVRKHYFEDD